MSLLWKQLQVCLVIPKYKECRGSNPLWLFIDIINKIAFDNEFSIVEVNTDLDHIHLLIDCKPQHYIPNIIKALKGVSARLLMIEYGNELKKKLWGGHLWNPSYFIATVSENTEEQIKNYIKNQKQK